MSKAVILYPENEILFKGLPIKDNYCYWISENAKTHFEILNSWGFNSFHAVKTIVRRFYPEVDEKELLELYQGTVIRESVLKYVHYTYQILNV
jgi:hypothetical protein